MIFFSVVGVEIIIHQNEDLIFGMNPTPKCYFTFPSSKWRGLTKTVVFSDGENQVDVKLTGSYCYVPSSLMVVGKSITVGVCGCSGDTVLPSKIITLGKVKESVANVNS